MIAPMIYSRTRVYAYFSRLSIFPLTFYLNLIPHIIQLACMHNRICALFYDFRLNTMYWILATAVFFRYMKDLSKSHLIGHAKNFLKIKRYTKYIISIKPAYFHFESQNLSCRQIINYCKAGNYWLVLNLIGLVGLKVN
jgi:hypothetical protein